MDHGARTCTRCHESKPPEDFYAKKRGSICKLCSRAAKRLSDQRFNPRSHADAVAAEGEGPRECSCCGQCKAAEDFYFNVKRGRWFTKCKACAISTGAAYRAAGSGNTHKRTPLEKAEQRRRQHADRTFRPYRPMRPKAAQFSRLNVRYCEVLAMICRAASQPLRNAMSRELRATRGAREYARTMARMTAEDLAAYRHRKKLEFRERYRLHTDKERLRVRKWKAVNPHRVKQWQTRRAHLLELQSDGTLTQAVVNDLFAKAHRCPYCQCGLNDSNKSLDHIEPIAHGGLHSVFNVVVCCRPCNYAKGDRSPAEWLERCDAGRVGSHFSRGPSQPHG